MDKSADAYRTISEVAEELKLPQHVLRFWETRFPQIKPMKRGGNRRFYRPEDVELLRAIRAMLYGDGYTIKGVQRILKQQGPRAVAGLAQARPKRPPGRDGVEADPGSPDLGRVDAHERSRPATLPQRVAAARDLMTVGISKRDLGGLRSDVIADPPDAGAESPSPGPMPAGYASYQLAERLQAVLYDIAECERLLAATRD